MCWGDYSYGKLGIGPIAQQVNVPTQVVGLESGVVAISAGEEHTCAVAAEGSVKCWGKNSGALGDGTGVNRNVPVQVIGLTAGAVAVSAGSSYSCSDTSTDGLWCWGENNFPTPVAGF